MLAIKKRCVREDAVEGDDRGGHDKAAADHEDELPPIMAALLIELPMVATLLIGLPMVVWLF